MATRLNGLFLSLDSEPSIYVSPSDSYGKITFYVGDGDGITSSREVGFITSVRYKERLERAAAEFNRIMSEPAAQQIAEAAE